MIILKAKNGRLNKIILQFLMYLIASNIKNVFFLFPIELSFIGVNTPLFIHDFPTSEKHFPLQRMSITH
jgi:hypothetical protein